MADASKRATVVIDTYGGDEAPSAWVQAAARISVSGAARVLLLGDAPTLQEQLGLVSYDPTSLRIVPVPIPYPRRPSDTLAKTEAARRALPVAFQMLADGEADALVSASPSSLVLELAQLLLEPLAEGVPVAAAAVIPTLPRSSGDDPFALLLDVSGRHSRSGDDLVAFARMGTAYARVVSRVAEPTVALLSTDLSASDGPPEVVAAHERLRGSTAVHFVGNVRAVDIPRGYADVVVTDGFTGHTVRGLLDGVTQMTVDAARYAWKAKIAWRIGLRLLSQGVRMLRKASEFREYGGAPLLGLSHLVLVASPDSSRASCENVIKLAAKCQQGGLIGEIARALDGAARPETASNSSNRRGAAGRKAKASSPTKRESGR